jgi:hypothetical protein
MGGSLVLGLQDPFAEKQWSLKYGVEPIVYDNANGSDEYGAFRTRPKTRMVTRITANAKRGDRSQAS